MNIIPDPKLKRFAALLPMLVLILPGAAELRGQDTPGNLQQSAYQQTLAQESVRTQAEKIQAQLAALIEALKQNGLDPSQVGMLTKASSRLSSLNQAEMQQVINALQSASMASDDPKRVNSLVTAYAGQKDLVLKLKTLSAQIAAQQMNEGLVEQLESLIARQSGNLRHTTDLAAAGTNDAARQAQQKLVATEQSAVGGETNLLLDALSSAPADSDTSGVAKAVLAAVQGTKLKADAADATRLTSGNNFDGAQPVETAVRDELTILLQAALANQDATTRLEQAKTQLDQVAADQQDIAAATKDGKLDAASLAERQAKIQDRAEVAQALLRPLQPEAADQVKTAQDAIQKSSQALAAGNKGDEAAAKQQQAADSLAKAQDLLAKQMVAVAAQENASPVDKLAQIQKAQDEIKQAQALAQTNPQQAAQAAAEAQKDALAPSPTAAAQAGDAANKLQQPQPNTAAANQSLANANAALQKEKDALAQTAQAYQALADASAQLTQAQQSSAAADQAMNGGKDMTQAAHDLNQAQNGVSQSQQSAQQGNAPQDAKDALKQAGDALKNAVSQAAQAKGADAKSQNGKAMGAMQKAKAGLDAAMAKLAGSGSGGQGNSGGPSANGNAQGGMPAGGTATDFDGAIFGGGTGSEKGIGNSDGVANVVGDLTPKDREAISQYQAEKSPPDYAPMVQQYLKNLADTDDTH